MNSDQLNNMDKMMKLFFKYVFLISILLFSGSSCDKGTEGDNLVKNPSFEEVDDNESIENWRQSSWLKAPETRLFASSREAYSGTFSAQISNFQNNHSYYSQIIEVKENTRYEITAFIKTETVGTEGVGASISVSHVNSAIGDVKGTRGWEKYGFNLKTEAGIKSIELFLSLGFYGSLNIGTAWFDRVSVTEVSSFNNNFPVKIIQKKEKESVNQDLPPKEKQLKNNIKKVLDIFSIFAGIILFLGTVFYMVFVIHEDIPKENGQKDKSRDDNLEKLNLEKTK